MGLSPNQITLWTFHSPPVTDREKVEAGLSYEEREKAARFHFDVDRHRYGFFHMTMRNLLASVLPITVRPEELHLIPGEFGKPTLRDFPEVHFNLTHSKDLAALAVCTAGPVGLDLEMIDPEFPVREIAREYFVGGERAAIDHAPDDSERTNRFFQLWTAKEAVMKVTGLGMNLEPRSIELALDPATARPTGFHHIAGFPTDSVDWKLRVRAVEAAAVLSLVYPSCVTSVAYSTDTDLSEGGKK